MHPNIRAVLKIMKELLCEYPGLVKKKFILIKVNNYFIWVMIFVTFIRRFAFKLNLIMKGKN